VTCHTCKDMNRRLVLTCLLGQDKIEDERNTMNKNLVLEFTDEQFKAIVANAHSLGLSPSQMLHGLVVKQLHLSHTFAGTSVKLEDYFGTGDGECGSVDNDSLDVDLARVYSQG
jgi:hypothetical protein